MKIIGLVIGIGQYLLVYIGLSEYRVMQGCYHKLFPRSHTAPITHKMLCAKGLEMCLVLPTSKKQKNVLVAIFTLKVGMENEMGNEKMRNCFTIRGRSSVTNMSLENNFSELKLVTDNLPLHLCRSQLRSH